MTVLQQVCNCCIRTEWVHANSPERGKNVANSQSEFEHPEEGDERGNKVGTNCVAQRHLHFPEKRIQRYNHASISPQNIMSINMVETGL